MATSVATASLPPVLLQHLHQALAMLVEQRPDDPLSFLAL
jgi:hypothetical protein